MKNPSDICQFRRTWSNCPSWSDWMWRHDHDNAPPHSKVYGLTPQHLGHVIKKWTGMFSSSNIFEVSLQFIWVYLHDPDQRKKTWTLKQTSPNTPWQEVADQKQILTSGKHQQKKDVHEKNMKLNDVSEVSLKIVEIRFSMCRFMNFLLCSGDKDFYLRGVGVLKTGSGLEPVPHQ